jgi:hypothetical protein
MPLGLELVDRVEDGDSDKLGDTDEVEEELTAKAVIDGVDEEEPITDCVSVPEAVSEGVSEGVAVSDGVHELDAI